MSAVARSDTYDLRSRSIYKFDIRPLPAGMRRRSSRRRGTTKRCATSSGPRKSTSIRKQKKKNHQPVGENNKKMGGKCPPPVKASEDDDVDEDYEEQCRDAAEPALKYYNREIAPYDGGIIYEMVDCGVSTGFFKPMEIGSKYHSNFTAKPLYSDNDCPPMLFFAEVWRDIYPDTPVAVLKCQRLGPEGQVFTGHNGCRACSPDFGEPIHHPLDGDFDVGSRPCLLSSTVL